MLKCIFPNILIGMSIDGIGVNKISEVINKSPDAVRKKLSGDVEFDVAEAMKINEQLFPDIPFKELFRKYAPPDDQIAG